LAQSVFALAGLCATGTVIARNAREGNRNTLERLGVTIGLDTGGIGIALLILFAWCAVRCLFVDAQGPTGVRNTFHLMAGVRNWATVGARWIQRGVRALEVGTGDGADPLVRNYTVRGFHTFSRASTDFDTNADSLHALIADSACVFVITGCGHSIPNM
jgi:hypothetical protein